MACRACCFLRGVVFSAERVVLCTAYVFWQGVLFSMRKGTVVLMVYSFKSRNPFFKALAWHAQLNFLEWMPTSCAHVDLDGLRTRLIGRSKSAVPQRFPGIALVCCYFQPLFGACRRRKPKGARSNREGIVGHGLGETRL